MKTYQMIERWTNVIVAKPLAWLLFWVWRFLCYAFLGVRFFWNWARRQTAGWWASRRPATRS